MAEAVCNRPLLVIAIGFLLGLSLREYPWNALFLIPIVWLAHSGSRCLMLSSAFAVGAMLSPAVPKSGVRQSEYVEAAAVVVATPRLYPERIAYEIEMQGQRFTVVESSSIDRCLGDRLEISGLIRPLREGSEAYDLTRGVTGRCQPTFVRLVSSGPIWYHWASEVRKAFVQFTKTSMSVERAAILDALCFNVGGGLSDEFESDLRATGTIHIISASGLHVFLLAVALEWLLGRLPIPRWTRILLLGLLLSFYAAIAGLQPAIVRTVLMTMVGMSAYIWRREADLLSSLSLAAIAYLLYDPFGIYNIGFQISFLTIVAFGLFGQVNDTLPRTAWEAYKQSALQALQTTHIAFWATLPILAFYFGAASLIAIPANLAVLPLVSVLVVGGMGIFAASSVFPALANGLADLLLNPFAALLQKILELFGNLTYSTLYGPFFSGYLLAVFYLLFAPWVKAYVRPA